MARRRREPSSPFVPVDDGFAVLLPLWVRAMLWMAPLTLRSLLEDQDPGTDRLFPIVYEDDPEREAAVGALLRMELTDRVLGDALLLQHTAHVEHLSAVELERWATALNSIRLVIGTRLGLDDDSDPPLPPHPDSAQYGLYATLSEVLGLVVDALATQFDRPIDSGPDVGQR